MSRIAVGIISILVVVAALPFGLIALSRSRPSSALPVHLWLDMDKQQKFKGQSGTPMFADGRAMRPLIPGVVAREDMAVGNEVLNDPAFPRLIDGRRGTIAPEDQAAFDRLMHGTESKDGKPTFVTKIPVPVTMDLMRRGRERYAISCTPCHGASGYGDGMVARRAKEMQDAGADTASGWVAPASYHTEEIRGRADGHLYNTIANGIRSMPAYGKQVSVIDRWAIVAYVRALQRSQNAKPEDVPEVERAVFEK